jgi:hypothetical protein
MRQPGEIAATAVCIVGLAGCGSGSSHQSTSTTTATRTSTPSVGASATNPAAGQKVALLMTCARALTQYQTLAADLQRAGPNPGANASATGQVIADSATLNTDLAELRAHGTTDQQAKVDQYTSVLSQLQQALQSAVGGNLAAAAGELTGLGPQLGQIPSVINSICGI